MAKTVRLTNAMLDRIRVSLIKHRFGKEEEALEAEATAIGPRLYDTLMGEHKATALALPDGFVKRSSIMQLRLLGVESYFSHAWDGRGSLRLSTVACRDSTFVLPDDVPMPVYSSWPYNLARTDPLFVEIADLNLRAAKLVKARKEMNGKLTATLGAFTTVNKLVEAWPEVLPFCPSTSEFAAPFLPAVPTDELNKALNLKPAEEA